jgi:hypothetical protein
VMLVNVIVMHCAVIFICCLSGLREEYVCDACYCNCNALRCDIDLLPFWTAAGMFVIFVTLFVMYCAVI